MSLAQGLALLLWALLLLAFNTARVMKLRWVSPDTGVFRWTMWLLWCPRCLPLLFTVGVKTFREKLLWQMSTPEACWTLTEEPWQNLRLLWTVSGLSLTRCNLALGVAVWRGRCVT